MQFNTFYPKNPTVNLGATTSSGRVALTAFDPALGTVKLYNSGTVDVFVNFGDSSVTAATTTSMPLKGGNTEVFGVGDSMRDPSVTTAPTHVAMITASGSATVYATSGVGA